MHCGVSTSILGLYLLRCLCPLALPQSLKVNVSADTAKSPAKLAPAEDTALAEHSVPRHWWTNYLQ